jgi:hypothetical protein
VLAFGSGRQAGGFGGTVVTGDQIPIGRLEQAAGNGPSLDTVYKVAKALGTTGSALLAVDHSSDEVTGLVQGLPEREREIACVMLRALSVHTSTQQP